MAETLTATSGLSSREGAVVPLVGVSVEAQIRDYACRVVLTQRFRNAEDVPIEAVYKFPLDEGAAVCGFEVEIDGSRVVGRVEEREKAFETYDEALSAGHGAYLLDEERADVFTASVGNLPPGKEAVLRITTVSELPLAGDDIRFTVPTTVAPRYAPEEDRKGVGETEAERLSPPYALRVPYGLDLRLDVETSAPVRSIESPSHPVKVAIEAGRATVTLSEREAALDRDVVIQIALAETHQPRAVVERGPDGQVYALLSFRPRLDPRPVAAEVVFLVDRSGSMQGSSIAEARNALQLALRSLRSGCAFNVVGFGSTFQALFPESRAYDDASLAEATAHVRGMEADLGGTEILPALETVLEAKPREGLPRQVFVLTDGDVSNTDAVIALARRHAADTRVFTFGIGAGASHHLVEGLARAGEGAAELIAPGERVEAKVMRQLARALSPVLSQIELDWGGPGVEAAPYEVPPVFAEGRVLVFGRFEKAERRTVVLRATGPDGPEEPGRAMLSEVAGREARRGAAFRAPLPEPCGGSDRLESSHSTPHY
jgi:Mg-chelatase subunit ChlD